MCCSLGPGFVGDTFLYGSLLVEVFEYLHESFRWEFCWLPSSDRKLFAEIPLDLGWRGGVFLNNPYLLLYCENAEFFGFSFLASFHQFFSHSLAIARLRGQILKFPVSGIRKQQSLFQFFNFNSLKINFYFCEMVWNTLYVSLLTQQKRCCFKSVEEF